MADDKIEIEIVLDDGSVKKGLANVRREGGKTAKDLSSSFRGLTSAVLGLGTALLGVFAGRKIINAAAEAEQSVQDLNAALVSAGQFSIKTRDNIVSLADAFEQTTTTSAEQFQELVSLGLAYTGTAEAAAELSKVAVDFAAGAGITAVEAVRRLGRGVQGSTGDIANFASEIRDLTKDQLQAGEATRILGERFAGAAQQQAKTFTGTLIRLQAVFGRIPEEIGKIITQSPALLAIFEQLSKEFVSLSNSLSNFSQQGDVLGDAIRILLTFRDAVVNLFIIPLEIAFNAVKAIFSGVILFIQTGLAGLAKAASAVVGFFAPDSELSQNLKAFAESTGEVFAQFEENTASAVSNIFNTDFSESSQGFLDRLNDAVVAAKDGPLKDLEDATAQTAETAVENLFAIGKLLKGPISTLIKNGISRIGASLVQGGSAFKDFGKFVLGTIGDLLINVGFAISGIGEAIKALTVSLGTLSGGFAIAAGFALIALGGVLKGVAGGAGGLGATGTAGTATGGGGVVAPGTTLATEADEDTDVTPEDRTRVAINIQGDVLDSRDTGLRIVDILNESFDTEGTVLVTT